MMPVRRRRRLKRNYTILPNHILYDQSIGSDEKAALFYLLSQPENWKVIPAVLASAMGWGRDKTYKVLKRLRECGYVGRSQERDVWSQNYGEVVYTVYSHPEDNRDYYIQTDRPLPEPPLPAKPDQIISTYRYKEISKANDPVSSLSGARTDRQHRREPCLDKLADQLWPGDREGGYDMLPHGAELEELLAKQRAGCLSENDLRPFRAAYISKGLKRSIQ